MMDRSADRGRSRMPPTASVNRWERYEQVQTSQGGAARRVLITGAAGNLGSRLAGRLLKDGVQLNLMEHRTRVDPQLAAAGAVTVVQADLGLPATLTTAFKGVDCVVHLAGKLFAPSPERFLPTTNVAYLENAVAAALAAGASRFVLISFPQVEGESNPQEPAAGYLLAAPHSVHAQTRLQAEKRLLQASDGAAMDPVILRSGLIYGRGVLMIEAARWLMARRLLGVWPGPTWMHPLSLPDFLQAVATAIDEPNVAGVYNLGDEAPLTLQGFLDRLAAHWGYRRPWRAPVGFFLAAAWMCEAFARVSGTAAPLTRDFIRIGTASYVMDTSRSREDLLPQLAYPTLDEGLQLLS